MYKTEMKHAVVVKNGVVKQVGRSAILQRKPKFGGGKVKWYDDSKLIRKKDDK